MTMPKLVALAGLSGSGKSTIARELARRTGAIWLRIDSMDRAIWASGTAPSDLQDWTYRAAQAVAADNLLLGRDVIGDCVNDCAAARDGWNEVGRRTGADVVWLEIVCSDLVEHRKRVETRLSDIPGHVLPTWEEVRDRDFEAWGHHRRMIDTAHATLDDCIAAALSVWRP
jgi:predicted kinase